MWAIPGISPRRVALLAFALVASAFAAGPSRAQLGFTELALTDTLFNTGPNTDFWVASAAAADVDGDGDLDLLVTGYYVVYFGSVEEHLTLYRNDGPVAGGWALTPIPVDAADLYFSSGDIAWGDYDGDGDPDAVVTGDASTTLYRNDAGTLVRTSSVLPDYQEEPDFMTMDQRSVSWSDVDNDGDLDLLLPCIWDGFGVGPTQLLRNDGPGTGDAWTFTATGSSLLPATGNAAMAWADMDVDGDLDLMFANMGQYETPTVDLYRNDGGTLVAAETGLASISFGTADWADADGDGDFDLVVGGNLILPDETGETVVRVLFRTPAGWTPVDVVHEFQSPEEPWLDFEGVTWADYDSDGDVDLLITGQQLGDGEIVGRSEVYANSGGVFALAGAPLPAPNFGNTGGAFTWFDVDGDGDLDYFVAGAYYVPGGNGLLESRAQLFRNDAAASNAAPGAPVNLQVAIAGNDATLSWSPSTDDRTPAASLSYELALTGPGTGPLAGATARIIPQPGNVSRNTTWTVHGLAPGHYSWTVRAIDSAFNGSSLSSGSFGTGSTAVDASPRPRALDLAPAAPNPSAGESRFVLALERRQHVSIGVYDVTGKRVASLHDGPLGPGSHTFTLHGEDLRSGLYFIHARGETGDATQRLTLFR